MRSQPRLQDFNQHQREQFNEMRQMINKGFLPSALVNPELLKYHNEVNPQVAQITTPNQPVNLQALAMLYIQDRLDAVKLFNYIAKVPSVSDVDLDSSTTLKRSIDVQEDPLPKKPSNVRKINLASGSGSATATHSDDRTRSDRATEAFDDTYHENESHH